MNQNDHEKLVAAYFEAAGALIDERLRCLKADQPEEFGEISRIVAAGEPLMLLSAFGKDGILATRLTVRIRGQILELFAVEGRPASRELDS